MSVILVGPISIFVNEVLAKSMQLLLSAPKVRDSTIVARSKTKSMTLH